MARRARASSSPSPSPSPSYRAPPTPLGRRPKPLNPILDERSFGGLRQYEVWSPVFVRRPVGRARRLLDAFPQTHKHVGSFTIADATPSLIKVPLKFFYRSSEAVGAGSRGPGTLRVLEEWTNEESRGPGPEVGERKGAIRFSIFSPDLPPIKTNQPWRPPRRRRRRRLYRLGWRARCASASTCASKNRP